MHDSFVTPAQWLAWATVEAQALDLFMARHGWPTQPITVLTSAAATPNLITMEDDFMVVLGVWELEANGKMRRLTHLPYTDARYASGTGVGQPGTARHYSITQSPSGSLFYQMTIAPFQAGATFVAHVLTTRTTLALDTSVRYPLGAEERIVLGMARRALMKEDSDVSGVSKLIVATDDHIEDICWSRALAEAPRVRNVDHVERGWSMPPHTEWVYV